MLTWALSCLYSNAIYAIQQNGGKVVFPEWLFIVSIVADTIIIMFVCCTFTGIRIGWRKTQT